jgi:uncharacterized protein YkwD
MRRTTGAGLVVLLLALVWAGAQAASGRVAGRYAKRIHRKTPRARAAAARCAGVDVPPSRANAPAIDAAMLCLVNRERARYGLATLRASGTLHTIASGQARDMVKGRYFGDDSLAGKTPLQRVKAARFSSRPLTLGQNIGWGSGTMATPRAMVSSWMHSPGHRKITLNPAYRYVGAGVAPGVPRKARGLAVAGTYVLDFVGTAG